MVIKQKTYLQSTYFKLLENWSVQYILETKFSYNEKYELTVIGDFLSRNKTPIDIEDDKEYRRVTIKVNNGGVFLRDVEIGKNIGTKKQFVISKGQFLLSKIDARNGAFGVVPEEVDGAIITGNFWTFDVDLLKINPHFLALITTTPEFIRFSENASNGTTNRHYLQEDLFLAQRIPLPSLPEQNRIVEAYNEKVKIAKENEEIASRIETDVQDYLETALKIKTADINNKKQGLQFVHFRDTSRWDSLFLIGNLPTINSKYPLETFGNVISSFNKAENGESIRINSTDYPTNDFHFIGMEHIEKKTGNLLEMNCVKGKEVKSQTLRVPKGFLLFGKLRPYLNKYWLNQTDIDNIICSSEFFVFNIVDTIDKMFFKYVLSSNFIQLQIADKTSGARMPRINETIFFNLQFPLPPFEVQKKISNEITSMKQQMTDLKTKANKNRLVAIQEFENEIFKPCN